MSEAVLNGELSVTYPESFHVMDAKEMAGVFLDDASDRWAIWDTDAHVIVAVMWHESGKFVSKLAGVKSLAERVEKHAAKAYKNAGYSCKGYRSFELCGQEACAVDFEYQVQGVQQLASVAVFKHEGCSYTIYSYVRKENAAEAQLLVNTLLDSLKLA